jgi:hypothetical protein
VSVSDLATLGLVLLVLIGLFALMWRGWSGRGARQAAAVGEIPSSPEQLTELDYGPVRGVYVGSTLAPNWTDRVAVGDWGFRAVVNISRYRDGYLIERARGNPMWIADSSVVQVRRADKAAGKVIPGNGLLVIRWELPTGTVIDSGFRADDKKTYRKLIDARDDE